MSEHKIGGSADVVERQLAEQAEASYRRMVMDQQAGAGARKAGASATPERA